MAESVVFLTPDLEPFALSDEANRVFEKELIYCGLFSDGKRQFQVTEDVHDPARNVFSLRHWESTVGERIACGLKIGMPKEHFDDPKSYADVVSAVVRPNECGIPALYGRIKFRDPKDEALAASTNVSIFSPPEDSSTGRKVPWPITHVAFTDFPLIKGLENFKAIAASLVTGAPNMSMQSLAEALQIPVADKDDAALETAIKAAIDQMKSDLDTATKDVARLTALLDENGLDPTATPESMADPAADPAAKDAPVAASMIGLLRDNVGMKLDKLIGAGKITPAQRKLLETEYASDKALALSAKGGKSFDAAFKILDAGEPTVSFAEKTRGQTRPLAASRKAGEKSPVAEAVDKMREKAGLKN